MKNLNRGLALAAIFSLLAIPALAEGEQGEMDPEMMQKMMQAGSPNDHHDHLAKLVGDWTAKIKMWAVPGAPVQEMEGKSHNEMIFGGRYLQQSYEGSWMGQPFHGMGVDGYDNVLKQHFGTWIDSASTTMMRSIGNCSDGGKVLSTVAEYADPMSGGVVTMKSKLTLVSDNEFTYEAWAQGEDGEFFKNMEITYTK